MKKYRVTYYFSTYAEVEVKAKDKMEALEKAAYTDTIIDKQLVANAIEIDKPDVVLIKE